MPLFNFKDIKISAIASAVPKTVVHVDDFIPIFGADTVSKFKAGTGISEFRKASTHQTASDLGYVAAQHIIKERQLDISTIGALIFVAHSTDYRRPATACVLHKRLNLSKNCAAFDISLGCSAFVYGLQTICSMMSCSNISRALLIVGETLSKMVYPEDKAVAMLFGDGGSAVFLEKELGSGSIGGLLKTDGDGYRAIIAPAGGFRNLNAPYDVFTWEDGNQRTLYNNVMNGSDVFSFSISDVPKTMKQYLELTNTTIDDYDLVALHQANLLICNTIAKKMKIPPEKMPFCLDRYGNSSAAAIPILLCDSLGNDFSNRRLNVLMSGFGVGLSWGICSAIINTNDIFPILETDEVFEEGIINSPEDYYSK